MQFAKNRENTYLKVAFWPCINVFGDVEKL